MTSNEEFLNELGITTIDFNYIRVVNGRWTLNRKEFSELTVNERSVLAEKIKS